MWSLLKFISMFVSFFFATAHQKVFFIPIFRISLLVLNSKLGELKSELLTESNKLEAKVDFFNSRYREFAVTLYMLY